MLREHREQAGIPSCKATTQIPEIIFYALSV
jgi:hypothetical protein